MSYAKYYEDNADYIIEDRGLTLGPFMNYESVMAQAFKARESIGSVHHRSDKYRCPLCIGHEFQSKQAYFKHINEVHTDNNVQCLINGTLCKAETTYCSVPPSRITIRNYTNHIIHVNVTQCGSQQIVLFDVLPDSSVDILREILGRTKSSICAHFSAAFSNGIKSKSYLLTPSVVFNQPQMLTEHAIRSEWYDGMISECTANRDELTAIMLIAISEDNETYIEDLAAYLMNGYDFHTQEQDALLPAVLCYILYKGPVGLEKAKEFLPTDYYCLCASVYYALIGKYDIAEELTNHFNHVTKDNIFGVALLIVSTLTGNINCSEFYKGSVCTTPVLQTLKNFIIPAFTDNTIRVTHTLKKATVLMKTFKSIPLISALIDAYLSIEQKQIFADSSAIILNNISPSCAYYYCLYTSNDIVAEKRWKKAFKRFPSSDLIRSHYECGITAPYKKSVPSDGKKYEDYIQYLVKNNSVQITNEQIDWAISGDDFYITPISGGARAGESCFILSVSNRNIMIDCGGQTHGGEVFNQLDNWGGNLDAVIISHAHTDHVGALSKVHTLWPCAQIYSSYQTKALLSVLLHDQSSSESSDDWNNLAIEKAAAEDTYQNIIPVLDNKWQNIADNIQFRFHKAGHIPGSMMIEIRANERSILYTGDFSTFDLATARGCDLDILPRKPDLLICEATLLDEANHELYKSWDDQRNELAQTIENEARDGHCILLPVSAIGKCQEVLCLIAEMRNEGRIDEDIPLYIGGLAEKASTALIDFMTPQYERHLGLFKSFSNAKRTERKPIIIASGNYLQHNTLAGKAFLWCKQQYGKYSVTVITTSHSSIGNECRAEEISCSLDNHARRDEIAKLLQIQPRVVSFVHWSTSDYESIKKSANILCQSLTPCPFVADLTGSKQLQINDIANYIGGDFA